jgi:hypothetical protein
MNLEMRKISDWVQNNKLKFNENKSKVMLISRRKRKEKRRWKYTYIIKFLKKLTK